MPSQRRRCDVCGSQRWHKEPRTGLITCREGHVLQNYIAETNETTDLGSHLVKKRTLRAERRVNSHGQAVEHKVFHGPRARYLYFQCLQLLFRKQVLAMTATFKLPDEYEGGLHLLISYRKLIQIQTVCRELWALHLSLIPKPPEPEPLLDEADIPKSKRTLSRVEEEGNPDLDLESHSSESQSDSGESELSDIHVDLPSQPGQSAEATDNAAHETTGRRGRRLALDHDGPIHNLTILTVACWLLRVPLVFINLIRAVEKHEIPYLDPRSQLPSDMNEHLSKYVRMMLAPRWAPKPETLLYYTSRMARLLYSNFAIVVPEFNYPPLMWHLIRRLHAPSFVYEQTQKLAELLDLPLTLHSVLNPPLETLRPYDPRRHEGDSEAPEVSLVAVLVIALKLNYRHGKIKRSHLGSHAEELRREASLARHGWGGLHRREASHTVLDLETREIDQYLEFCDSAFVTEQDEFARMEHMFQNWEGCLPDGGSECGNDNDAGSEPDLGGHNGCGYNEWSALLVESAARETGWGAEEIAGSVERMERRLRRWWKGRKGQLQMVV